MEEQKLAELNVKIGDWEAKGETEVLAAALSDQLVFKRADGVVVTKKQFLSEVRNKMFARKSEDVKILINEAKNLALVALTVEAQGGKFENLRVFERSANGWQCVIWHNSKIN